MNDPDLDKQVKWEKMSESSGFRADKGEGSLFQGLITSIIHIGKNWSKIIERLFPYVRQTTDILFHTYERVQIKSMPGDVINIHGLKNINWQQLKI